KGGKMVTRDFTPHGRAAQALKDVRLMLAQAERAGQELPGCEVAAALLESCVRHGEGEKDSTVIVEDIRRRVARPVAAHGGARSWWRVGAAGSGGGASRSSTPCRARARGFVSCAACARSPTPWRRSRRSTASNCRRSSTM